MATLRVAFEGLKDNMTTMTRRNAAPVETILLAHPKAAGRSAGVDIKNRRPMQWRTVKAITEAAKTLGAVARPVIVIRTGATDEVHLFRDGALRASIFVPTTGRLGIWRSDTDQATANTPAEAARRALDPVRKYTRKLAIAA
jgi:hypothetical protein